MRTIQRLYLYVVAFISLEVVIWGLIKLARSMLSGELIGSSASQLASALSLIAVGVPVFLLHWWLLQRKIHDPDERFAWLRFVFLYGVLLTTLIPIVQNILAFVNRVGLRIFDLPERMAFIGVGQSWVDNLIAVVANGLMAAYFYSVLQKDRKALPLVLSDHIETMSGVRRLYRYIWVVYGLAMVIGGMQQILVSILNLVGVVGKGLGANLANGLSLLVIGIPLWVYCWRNVQNSLVEETERKAPLRLIVLFIVSLVGIGGVLIPLGMVIHVILQGVLERGNNFRDYLTQMSEPLSVVIPFVGLWLYYEGFRRREVAALPDENRRAGLRRLYHYILSFVGLVTTVIGLNALLSFLVDMFIPMVQQRAALWERLSMAISTLVIGVPLWLISWRLMVLDASQDGEIGDHARRSLVRKVYLYLALFSGVIGVMASTGGLIFQFLSKFLGDPPANFQRTTWIRLEILLLFALLLAYHWATLRADGRLAEKSLAARYEAYPVLVLAAAIGEFSEEILNALHREMPTLPVVVHQVDNGIPDETLSGARAVIISGEVAARPNEAIRIWMQGFQGIRLIVPTPANGWLWIFGSGRSISNLARQTAKLIRHLAEGETPPKYRETSVWMVIVYILAAVFGLPLLISLLSALGRMIY